MRHRVTTTILLVLQLTCSFVYSMQTFDMCATFQKTFTEKTLTLVTPGYLERIHYPNSSYCECTIESLVPAGRDKSLNVTVQVLEIEACSTSATPYDTLTVTAVYTFEVFFKDFVLCGDTRPISSQVDLDDANNNNNKYGYLDTIYSMDMFKLAFSTDGSLEDDGAQLLFESYDGLRVQCDGVSGPITTSVPVTTTTPPAAKTTPYKKKKPKNNTQNQSVTAGVVIGTILVLFAVGLGVLVFVLIRKHRDSGSHPSKPRNGAANGNEARRQSDGRPIYRDPCEGQPELPMPGSVRMQCTDEYLYMPNNDPTTPVYANPEPIIYTNQDMNVKMAEEEQYRDGYIIPGSIMNSNGGEERAPLMRHIPKVPNKPPIPQPKSSKPLNPPTSKPQLPNKDAASGNNHSSNSSSPVDSAPEAADSRHPANELVYSPALLKPSDMKKNLDTRLGGNAGNAGKPLKPAIKAKPKLKTQMAVAPPPAPNKSASLTSDGGDTYQVVDVQTT